MQLPSFPLMSKHLAALGSYRSSSPGKDSSAGLNDRLGLGGKSGPDDRLGLGAKLGSCGRLGPAESVSMPYEYG